MLGTSQGFGGTGRESATDAVDAQSDLCMVMHVQSEGGIHQAHIQVMKEAICRECLKVLGLTSLVQCHAEEEEGRAKHSGTVHCC